jgi:hypothetical protein
MMADQDAGEAASTGAGLLENLARFGRMLRTHGMAAPLSAVLEAAAGIAAVDPADPWAFHAALRATFARRREDLELFDALFARFWLSARSAGAGTRLSPGGTPEPTRALKAEARWRRPRPTLREGAPWYSPDPLHRGDQDLEPPQSHSAAVRQEIARLLRTLAPRRSRRWEEAARGARISLGRLLRRNIQYGGDLLLLRFRDPKIRKRRVLFLCDVSGSMDVRQPVLLELVHAVLQADRSTEVFFFSTELTRVTHHLRNRGYDEAVRGLPRIVEDWAGGTRIGQCLKRLRLQYGGTLLAARPVVIVYSDGWDTGEIDLLRSEMAHLKRRAHRILWLNPLMSTRGYEPTCRGMSAALPFVDRFLPLGRWQDLVGAGRALHGMIA